MVKAGPICSLATVPTRVQTPAPVVEPTPYQNVEEFTGEFSKKVKMKQKK